LLHTGIIILAGGSSSRLGAPKQLLQFKGRSLLRHAAETALASICRPVVVVLGSCAQALESELYGLGVIIAKNDEWASGMGSSIRVGMHHLMSNDSERTLDSVVLMVCDQPLIRGDDINRLCAIRMETGRGIVSSFYGGAAGVPALFSSNYFPELETVDPSQGARLIIAKHIQDSHSVPLSEAVFDVDTYNDYQKIIEKSESPAG